MKKFIFIGAIIFSFLFESTAFANDAAEAEMVRLLMQIEGFDELMEGYQNLMDGNIANQLTAMTGVTDLGTLLNGKTQQKDREWSPADWASALSGGNEQRYNELLDSYKEAHPTLTSSEATAGMSSTYAADYQQQVATNQAASTNATYAFNDTNKHLENIDKLSEQINQEKDTKHIQDLNARINAEIAYLQVEVIKGLAVVNQQLAQQQATEIQDRTAAAKFNTIPQ